ncbi:vacuolar iron transporter [Sporothrix brasiliensis 5110]|uniref:Vacuolar iron transporter n=1 Tax=Sporothrix brasiliensis 5110 TaxID=1398154 RepID=A0A0C2EW39_9PEZI|nr:vacuolar iron transporter [Sporothrix brasiliensis 5110]KIH90784.1 vacuolar iron transporter [Sporothrix brasiliensis 5110]
MASEVDPLIERRSDSSLTRVSSRSSSHSERHTDYNAIVRDIIIGFADGLTVPFALTAGLSSLGDTRLVVMGGLAELFSGAISMGLGAYLAAATEKEHYHSEEAREWDEIRKTPAVERQEIYDILAAYHISHEAATPLVNELCTNPEMWVRFMMHFELRLECPEVSRAWLSALTMGMSYFVGGLIPMIPYFLMARTGDALMVSIVVTAAILLTFGYVKTIITVHCRRAGVWGALQTLFIGALAAGASYGIVRALDSGNRQP